MFVMNILHNSIPFKIPLSMARFSFLQQFFGVCLSLALIGPKSHLLAGGLPANCGPQPGVRFVNDDATGTNDGSTWDNAHTSLAAALAAASPGEQIWVKQGTYRPTNGVSRTAAFRLKADVSLFGGFEDSGCPGFADRNPALFPTVLSGDIGVLGASADNSFVVVLASNVGNNVTMEGFTIRDGNSNTNGGGLYVLANGGGRTSSPTFLQCQFIGNTAAGMGGGVFVMSTNGSGAQPSFTGCAFSGNSAQGDGGGLATLSQRGGGITIDLDNCTFTGNSSLSRGGGLHNAAVASGGTMLNVSGCTFSGNTAGMNGGGMSNFARVGGTLIVNVSGSTFTANTAANGAGVFCHAQGGFIDSHFDDNDFLNNIATVNGSGYCAYTELSTGNGVHQLTDQQFIGNQGGAGAFAHLAVKGGLGSATLDRVLFRNNTSSLTGGAVHIVAVSMSAQANTTLFNTVCWGNSAGRAGGALYQLSNFNGLVVTQLVNSTVNNNTAPSGGAFFSEGRLTTALFDAYNCIVWQNPTTLATSRPFQCNGATSAFMNNSIIDSVDCSLFFAGSGFLSCGPDMFAVDPMFVDAATGDLHLSALSPAVDLGMAAGAPLLDFDQNPRPSGGGFDLGAYELIAGAPRLAALGEPVQTATAPELFPNPTVGHATLRAREGSFENAVVQVFDVQGRLIETHGPVNASSFDVDFSGRPEGMYIVRLNQNGDATALRIVVH
jgi:hypothetical protein